MKNIIIVGSGLAGSVLARKIAEEREHRVTVIEKRDHIGGNVYDAWQDGNLVQIYGPHFFITNEWWVVEFLMRFSEFYEYRVQAMSCLDGKYVDRPYNFKTLQQLLGVENSGKYLSALRSCFQEKRRVHLSELMSCEDPDVKHATQLLYDKIYATYVAKQWGLKVEELNQEVINRADFYLGYDKYLCDEDFQYLPKAGYTKIIENMLDHKNIRVEKNKDALDAISFDEMGKRVLYDGKNTDLLIFTGQLDRLFGYEYGELPYRSRAFEYEVFDRKHLPCEVVTYPEDREYLRQTEFSYFNPTLSERSVVQSEYSLPFNRKSERGNEPYYPIPNKENEALFSKYAERAASYTNLAWCGRLADYRYYDMDKVIIRAFQVFDDLIKKELI